MTRLELLGHLALRRSHMMRNGDHAGAISSSVASQSLNRREPNVDKAGRLLSVGVATPTLAHQH